MKRYTQEFPVRPIAKGRPRMTRNGHAYTPKRTLEYEQQIAALYKGPFFDEDQLVEVSLVFTKDGTTINIIGHENKDWKHPLKGDIDNYVKSVLDALNGVAWVDDKQIIQLTVSKL
jgi:Holliday junction resolvase RusA-like endonuclease